MSEPEAPFAPGAPCAYHAGNAASHLCERCGDFMCGLCSTPVEGRLYCPRCFDLLFTRGALQVTQQQFTLPGITLGVGIAAFLTSWACVGIPFAVGGIVAGVSALKEHRKRPELPNRTMTLVGLGLNVAALVIGTIILAATAFALSQYGR